MAFADGKTPDEVARRKQAPSSHAVRSVNARIQAGPIWQEIVHSDQLTLPAEVETPWQRMLAWRRTMPTSRLIGVGALAAAAITAVSLSSSPYRFPTLPDSASGGVNAITQLINPEPDTSSAPPPATDSSSAPASTIPGPATISKAVPRSSSPTPSPSASHSTAPSVAPSASGSASATSAAPTTGTSTTSPAPTDSATTATTAPTTASSSATTATTSSSADAGVQAAVALQASAP